MPVHSGIVFRQGGVALGVHTLGNEEDLPIPFRSQEKEIHGLIERGHLGAGDISALCPGVGLALDDHLLGWVAQVEPMRLLPCLGEPNFQREIFFKGHAPFLEESLSPQLEGFADVGVALASFPLVVGHRLGYQPFPYSTIISESECL